MNAKNKIRLKLYLRYLISRSTDYYNNYDNDKKNIVVALAADYGNLGDVAITYAQTKFLQEKYPEANVIDFPISKTFSHMKSLKKIIKAEDMITIVGGGNTGDMYDDIEYSRQFVIKNFPDNKVISFPQTIDFSNSQFGRKSVSRAQKVYSNHKNLTLTARENRSYNAYQQLFPHNRIIKTPDIVLSLDKEFSNIKREGIMLTLRSDKEQAANEKLKSKLIKTSKIYRDITFRDTHVDKNRMSVALREKELHKIWKQFSSSELVITDRLHGMIFAAITKTPCIALDNSNKKVSGVYEAWLTNLPYVKILNNDENIPDLVEEMLQQNNKKKTETSSTKFFDQLIK